jgi:hypothetical protein
MRNYIDASATKNVLPGQVAQCLRRLRCLLIKITSIYMKLHHLIIIQIASAHSPIEDCDITLLQWIMAFPCGEAPLHASNYRACSNLKLHYVLFQLLRVSRIDLSSLLPPIANILTDSHALEYQINEAAHLAFGNLNILGGE